MAKVIAHPRLIHHMVDDEVVPLAQAIHSYFLAFGHWPSFEEAAEELRDRVNDKLQSRGIQERLSYDSRDRRFSPSDSA